MKECINFSVAAKAGAKFQDLAEKMDQMLLQI